MWFPIFRKNLKMGTPDSLPVMNLTKYVQTPIFASVVFCFEGFSHRALSPKRQLSLALLYADKAFHPRQRELAVCERERGWEERFPGWNMNLHGTAW
jgi:hypothetical protein